MAKIKIPQLKKVISSSNKNQTLMETLLKHKVPVASSCDGDGVCSKCVLEVSGLKTDHNNIEKLFAKKHSWSSEKRLSCQVYLKDSEDISVSSTYW